MKNIVFPILIVLLFATLAFTQTQDRRIVFDRANCDDPAAESKDKDSDCFVELISVHIGNQTITSGKPISADENWLKELRVRVRNVSGRSFVAFGVAFGVIEGLYQELGPYESWGWGFALYRGKFSNPDDKKRKISKVVVLKPNEETELNFANYDPLFPVADLSRKMRQIVLRYAFVEFRNGKQRDSDIFIKKE